MSWPRRFFLVALCLLPWIGAGAAFAWVAAAHLPADGRFVLDIPIDGRSPWFEAFLPGQRATAPGPQPGGWTGQRLTDDPAYARLRLPGAYEEAEVRLEFRPNGQPLADIGVERGPAGSGDYELYPLWSAALSTGGYRPVELEGVRWWTRPGVSAEDVRRSGEQRLLWHASATVADPWMDAGPSVPEYVSSSLRGTHDFSFVPVDGRIDFTLWLQNMNRSKRHATATFRLTRGDTLVWTDALSFAGDEARPSVVTEKPFSFTGLEPGAYRLSLLADDTIFVRGWRTTAKHWVVGPRVYFADEVGYSSSTPPVAVWTNSHHLELKTMHAEGLQTVSLGALGRATLARSHEAVPLARAVGEAAGPLPLRAPKGNVWTLGDGYVSWRPEALFFPSLRRLTDDADLAGEAIQAVATPYEAPEPLGDGWYAATFRVALDPSLDRLKLVIATPGLARRGAAFDVRRFRVAYLRSPRAESWWFPFKQELLRAWRRW